MVGEGKSERVVGAAEGEIGRDACRRRGRRVFRCVDGGLVPDYPVESGLGRGVCARVGRVEDCVRVTAPSRWVRCAIRLLGAEGCDEAVLA